MIELLHDLFCPKDGFFAPSNWPVLIAFWHQARVSFLYYIHMIWRNK